MGDGTSAAVDRYFAVRCGDGRLIQVTGFFDPAFAS
jgi:hypothetical protein